MTSLSMLRAYSKRGPYDDLNTPEAALEFILPFISKDDLLWDCAPGNGKMINKVRKRGYRMLLSSNLDFLRDKPPDYDIILTNPPFSKKIAFLARARELGKPFAFLLPANVLGVRGCQKSLQGVEAIFLPKRIDFTGKKNPWFAVAWYTWGLNIGQQILFLEDVVRYTENEI